MSQLFTPVQIGTLQLPNRLVRSATAERMADATGRPGARFRDLQRELARGGVGLIITGHMYVHPGGKCHPEMAGVYDDALVPALAEVAETVHRAGGRIAVQINHGGMQCSPKIVTETLAPSALDAPFLSRPARELRPDETVEIIDAFGQAARRVREAGFDAVQIHAAHGYLISQFLSPYVNRREDEWGGDLAGRMRFLRRVSASVREQVGPDYPVLIKLGMIDGLDGGLSLEESIRIVAQLEGMGIDGVEVSGGVQMTSVKPDPDEAYFRPLAQAARPATRLPLILVGGLRSCQVMEEVLDSGDADLVSLCRPLISEPDFPRRMRLGLQERSRCISGNRCWPQEAGAGISCKCVGARTG
jgi:2,4-dienoyl-CoA reductase-like NADH-dependent reductase (Old Yellow Enzyme family)